ncbi:MAG TPA: FtsW/RodA/SpoVE family cell cycle protein, partial [Anaerolineaceae bacterium]
MSLFATDHPSPVDIKQSRLIQLAAVFLLLYAITLTLSPAARLHSWQVTYRWNHWIGFVVWLVSTTIVHRQLVQRLPERDPYLFPIAALLAGWGILTIWRLDYVMGARQTVWLAVSMFAFAAGLRIKDFLAFLRRYKYVWLTSGLLLTGLTFLFGTYPGGFGPRLWLGCCGVYLMPSEPLKLLLIAYLAAYLADQLPANLNLMQLLTPTLILVGAALVLLVGQRDLGTAFLFILIYTSIVFIASNKKRTLLISAVALLAAGVAGYLLFDVVRIRIDAWLDPWLDPAGRSYQIIQSIIAVASGEFLGRGPGMGSPGIVPVAHSDFIFSAIG